MATQLSPSLIRTNYRGKYPTRIYSVGMSKGQLFVVTNAGDRWLLSAQDTRGQMPKPGEDISKYLGN